MLNLLPTPKHQIYLDRYAKLIQYASTQQFGGYVERHHILPKSMFPEHKKDPKNLITVSPRIHFLLHYLLWKAYRSSSVWNAFKFMNSSTKNHSRYMNSKLYESLKIERINLTESHKNNISISCKGQPKSIETRKKMSEYQKGRPKPQLRGKTRTIETKQKMSDWQKGKPKPNNSGARNGKSIPVIFRGSHYVSLIECSRLTGISKHLIKKEITTV